MIGEGKKRSASFSASAAGHWQMAELSEEIRGRQRGLSAGRGEDRSNRTEGTAGHEQPSVFVPSAGEIPKQNHLL